MPTHIVGRAKSGTALAIAETAVSRLGRITLKALVVDDSRAIRLVLVQTMRALGYDAREACDGHDALARLGEEPRTDVLITDWQMPEMDGLTLVKIVRSQAQFRGLRIMMVTIENDLSQVAEALEAGVDEYVMKPFTREMIQEKLLIMGLDAPLRRVP